MFCLEVLTHKSGATLNSGRISMAMIEISDHINITEINLQSLQDLNVEWFKVIHYPITQKLGNQWVFGMKSAVLKVPSAIVDSEYNYLLNLLHPDFSKIKVVDVIPFNFDSRLKLNIN